MQTVAQRSPRVLPPAPARIAEKPARRTPHDWRYSTSEGRWITLGLSLFISAMLHGVLIYGFNRPAKPKTAAVVEQVEVIQIAMPELKDDEPPKVEELGDAVDEQPAVSVPMLADAPSMTVSAFVQPLQYAPDVTANLTAQKVAQIPVNIARGGKGVQNLGKIFEISQLDRVPTPIAQPAPQFPYSMKQQFPRSTVVVEFVVTENGEVVNINVTQADHRDFEAAAIAGVSKWRFRPGMKGGKKVNTRVRQTLNFLIEDTE